MQGRNSRNASGRNIGRINETVRGSGVYKSSERRRNGVGVRVDGGMYENME